MSLINAWYKHLYFCTCWCFGPCRLSALPPSCQKGNGGACPNHVQGRTFAVSRDVFPSILLSSKILSKCQGRIKKAEIRCLFSRDLLVTSFSKSCKFPEFSVFLPTPYKPKRKCLIMWKRCILFQNYLHTLIFPTDEPSIWSRHVQFVSPFFSYKSAV